MQYTFTHRLGLLGLGLLLPLAAVRAQTTTVPSAPSAVYARARAASPQWAGAGFTADDFQVSDAYTDDNGLEHVYIQQLYQGIPVYNRILPLTFLRSQLVHHAGSFVPAKLLASLPLIPAVTAEQAVSQAVYRVAPTAEARPGLLRSEGGAKARQVFSAAGVAKRDIAAQLTWVLDKAGRPHLAWNVNIDVLGRPDWWNVQVDAATGSIISQDNWTVEEKASDAPACAGYSALAPVPTHQVAPAAVFTPAGAGTATASYLVIPYPLLSPSTTALRTETDPWLKAGVGNKATTNGWHYDGTTDYAYTRGNNVAAYDDAANLNAPGNYAPSTTTGAALTFSYAPNFIQQPAVVQNRNAAVTNLFYWNNIMHDIMYQYGFTEAAGNFQASNLGRGGAESDYVKAEAQDGSGTNNANFSTPPDGTSGRMQMFLWNSIPIQLQVTAPASVAGQYTLREGVLSTANKLIDVGPVSGQLALYQDAGTSPTTNLACTSHAGPSLAGKIALITRSTSTTCTFANKVKNAQLAGAVGVIVVNNVAGAPVIMGGSDNTITIPAVMISQADGATLTAQLAAGVQVTLPRNNPLIDGDYDDGIVAHEYGHGVSSRLTGGPSSASCLANAEQAGEGWSDYFALMVTTDWTAATLTDGPGARPIGTYAFGQPNTAVGIRRYPYSTSMTTNPLTYKDMALNTEIHATGEIWCAALWDMTWNIIQQNGAINGNLYTPAANGGNTAALQLVVQGLKLQPCQPGFLDSRDAILAADSLLYGGRYHCAIWRAFARRGMGYSAQQGYSTSADDQTAAFDMPPPVVLQKPTALLSGNTLDVALQLNCSCTTPAAAYTLTDQLPAGMQYVSSSPAATVSGNTVTFANIQFSAPGQTQTFRFRAQATAAAACPLVLPLNDDRDANTVGGFVPTALSGSTTWASSTDMASSPTHAWAGPTPVTPTDYVLTSGSFTPSGLSTLSFKHFYNFEPTYDGGSVEISTDNGINWTNAAPYFIENGPNATFSVSTIGTTGVACYTGRSTPGTSFIRSVMNLASFTGQPLRVRFRVRTDTGNTGTYEGWFVDDIQVANGCGGTQHVELRDAANALAGSGDILTYLLPTPLATQTGGLAQALQLVAQPNPFGASGLNLLLTTPAPLAQVAFSIYDVTGRHLLSRAATGLAVGPTTIAWPEAAQLPAGFYLVRAQLPDGSSLVLRTVKE